jgi:hypothetical protein
LLVVDRSAVLSNQKPSRVFSVCLVDVSAASSHSTIDNPNDSIMSSAGNRDEEFMQAPYGHVLRKRLKAALNTAMANHVQPLSLIEAGVLCFCFFSRDMV